MGYADQCAANERAADAIDEVKELEQTVDNLLEVIKQKDKRINDLAKKLDGEVGYFYESMDFKSMAEYAMRADRKIQELEKENKLLKGEIAGIFVTQDEHERLKQDLEFVRSQKLYSRRKLEEGTYIAVQIFEKIINQEGDDIASWNRVAIRKWLERYKQLGALNTCEKCEGAYGHCSCD